MAIATKEEQGLAVEVHQDPWEAYVQAFYFLVTVLTSVGFGDISPTHWDTKIYISFQNTVGAVFLIAAGGRSGAYFITTDPLQLLTMERKRRLESLLLRNHVPWSMQRDAFAMYPIILDTTATDYQGIMNMLPEYMQERIGFHMKRRIMKKVPMFNNLSKDVIAMLSWRLVDIIFPPKTYLIHSGEEGMEMYFLSNGVVEVLLPDREGDEVWAANLTDGSWFGEIALLKKTNRIASVRSITTCACYKLEKADFERVMEWSAELRELMEEETRRRVEHLNRPQAQLSPPPPAHMRTHRSDSPPLAASQAFRDDTNSKKDSTTVNEARPNLVSVGSVVSTVRSQSSSPNK